MGVFCVNTKSKEFKDIAKRLNIHPDSLEVYVHLFLNSFNISENVENIDELPFPSDEQIREYFSLGNKENGTQAIDTWVEEHGATDGFINTSEVNDAINKYGAESVHTYKDNTGNIVHKVSRPNITSLKELKYFLTKLNIIDSNYNLLGITMDRFYERIDNLAIPADLLSPIEMKIIKKIAINNGTFMKAPNGKITNLTEKQWLLVRTKAFKDWFGDWINDPANASKVVDENGEPLAVYHTSDADFSAFDLDRRNSKDPGYYGKGFYFYTEPSNLGLENPVIKAYFLNVRTPLMQQSGDYSNTGKELPTNNDGSIIRYNDSDSANIVEDIDQITANNPNQIKSATDNNGLFSSENDNIYYEGETVSEKYSKPTTPLKKEYKGKLIFAQSGSGKTSIADNVSVIDSDYILASILGVNTALATPALQLLPWEQKEKVIKEYHKRIKLALKEGKTVVTSSKAMLPEADLIVLNPDLQTSIERTSRADRTNRIVSPEYQQSLMEAAANIDSSKKITLQKNQYLADIILTDPKFNIAVARINNSEFVEIVENFMNKFGISLEQFSDAGYSIDYLDRVIKGFDDNLVVKGSGELIAFMMQYNAQEKEIIANLAVEDGIISEDEIFKTTKAGNKVINDNAYKKLDKQRYLKTLGNVISQELKYQYDHVKEHGVFDYSHKINKSFFEKVLDIIREFLDFISNNRETINQIQDFSSYVAINVLLGNEALITASLRKPGDENAGPVERVDLVKALDEHPFERDILEKLNSLDITLAGSAAMSVLISIYRPSENPLHDMDFQTDDNLTREQLEDKIFPLFPNIEHTNTIVNDTYTTETYLVLDRPFTIEKSDSNEEGYLIKDKDENVIGAFKHSNLQLKEGVLGKFLDFFIKQKLAFDTVPFDYHGKSLKVGNYRSAMKAKIDYSRLKDIFDYNRAVPVNFKERPSYKRIAKEISRYNEHEYVTVYSGERDTRLLDLYDKHKDNKGKVSLKEIVSIIEQDDRFKGIINLLKNVSKNQQQKLLQGVKVLLVNPFDYYSRAETIRNKFGIHRGFYDSSNHTIYIDVTGLYKNGNAASVILHEVMHAITIDRILNNPEYRKEFQTIIDSYNSQLKFGEGVPYIGEHAIEEFIADIWSNEKTILNLKRMKALDNSKTSLWDKIKSFFSNVLFSNVNNKSLFALSSELLYGLLEQPVANNGTYSTDVYFDNLQLEIVYNKEQQNAIDLVSDYLVEDNPSEDYFLISGKAGTGKTFIINEIIRQVSEKTGYTPNVFITAVANKAVLNLGNKIEFPHGRKATASALGFYEYDKPDGSKSWIKPRRWSLDKLPISKAEVLFIDECSMLDTAKLDMILLVKKQLPKLKVVMIGDRGLIHSIEEKNTENEALSKEDLEDSHAPSVVFTYKNKREVLLVTRVRQGEDSPVLEYADQFWEAAVNGEDLPSYNKTGTVITKNGALITRKDVTSTIDEDFIEQITPVFEEARKTHNPDYVKIVALHVEQVLRYNTAIYKAMHPDADTVNYPVALGDMLMFYAPFGMDEDDLGNPIAKFNNSSEVVVEEVLSAPHALDLKQILQHIKDIVPSIKNLEKYENIKVLEIKVKRNGAYETITVVCPSPDNMETFIKLGRRISILGDELYKSGKGELGAAMKSLRSTLENKAAYVQFNYAISAHKSQGSTYQVVVADYRDIKGRRTKSEKYAKRKGETWGGFTEKGEKAAIMYTAVTRASNVTIVLDYINSWSSELPNVNAINELITKAKKGEDVSNEDFKEITDSYLTSKEKKVKETKPVFESINEQQPSSEEDTRTSMEIEDEKWNAIFDEHNDTIEFIEGLHEYWYYPLGKDHPEARVKMDTSVTSISNPIDRKDRDSKGTIDYINNGFGWLGTSGSIGTSADNVVRDYFQGVDITARKYPNFTKELLEQLAKDLKNFKLFLDKQFEGTSYRIVTNPFALVGKVNKYNGTTQTVGGTLDILIYDENGFYYIYDIKTSRSDLKDSDKLEHYTSQVNLYREMLEAMHPELKGCCGGLGILQLNTFYATPKNLRFKGSDGTVVYTVDDSNQLQADGKPIEVHKEYVAPHFPEGDVLKAVIEIKETNPEQYYLDGRHKTVTISAINERKTQIGDTNNNGSINTREDNLKRATVIPGSDKVFTGMLTTEELLQIAAGETDTFTRDNTTKQSTIDYYKRLKVGDILELHDKTREQSLLVKITKPFAKNGKVYQLNFEYVNGSYTENVESVNASKNVSRTVEDNLNGATVNKKSNKPFSANMWELYEEYKREDISSTNTLDAIVNGERTATTRTGHMEGFYDQMKVGDIIEFHDREGRSVLVKITKAPHILSPDLDLEEWSKKEGWIPERFTEFTDRTGQTLLDYAKLGKAFLLEYTYVEDSFVEPVKTVAKAAPFEIVISYKKDKENYRKGTPQKHKDTAYIFTENALAHNKLEGKEAIGPDVFVQLNVGKNREENDKVNQADIRTDAKGNKTKNAFGLIVKKYLADGVRQFVALEGCFKNTDEDFEIFTSMNLEMFDALEKADYKKVIFPFEIALGKAALPKRFAKWMQELLETRYGIISTIEKNQTPRYNGYGLRIQEIKENEKTPEIKGENISSRGSEFAKQLTNYGNTVSVEFNGRTYRNAEHAYQTWKSGEFDETAYNSTAAKPRGSKPVNKEVSDSIMVDILTAKLLLHPELVKGITDRGGIEYLKASTHDVIGDLHWETKDGKGDNGFINALIKAYQNVINDKALADTNTVSLKSNSNFTQSSGSYSLRTSENADWSDITIALATDFSTAGETLTAQQAGSTDEKYLGNKEPREGVEDKYVPSVINPRVSLDNLAEGIAADIFELLNDKGKTKNIKLNIAGNGIYTLANNYTQEQVNDLVYKVLRKLLSNGITISEIRSGGQTGVDEAGIIAAQKLGIKSSVHAPKDWTFRVTKEIFESQYKDRVSEKEYKYRRNGSVDIMNESLFKERFAIKETLNEAIQDLVDLVFKRIPELAEIGTKEEYAEYIQTIFLDSVDKSVYWHGTNEDMSEGFKSAKRGKGSGAVETQSRNDFYLAKLAWTVLQYVNGVNRNSIDKNGFAHWNKLWWELKEIMSNGRRENNDWKNIIIGDATLRQAIPNKKGIFNRDKGGENGKWLKERKADYGYEDKSDREFFEDIFGIEWNKDTFNSWIERNAAIFKSLEESQKGIYPVIIDVRNPITENGQNTYYEEERGLLSKADKEGFDTILGENTDNEFNSDVAVVINIGTTAAEMSKRIHFLGTEQDRASFRDFVDKKHNRSTQKEYDDNEDDKQESLISSTQPITTITEQASNAPLYTSYELQLIKERKTLNALKDDAGTIFKPSELSDLAKACMFLVSDFITQIQTNKNNNELWFKYLEDSNPRKQELLNTDFTQMERIEVCHKLGMTMYAIIQNKYFNAENNPNGSKMKRNLRKKLQLINLNFNAFLEMGQFVLAKNEEIQFDNTRVLIVNESEEVFNGQNIEEITEIAGSAIEHWQVSFRNVSAHASLSLLIKRTLGTLYKLDENGEQILNGFGIPERINESLAINLILVWTQGSEDLSLMVEKLRPYEKKNPWIKQIIDKLDDNSEDETFKAQFWSNFKKYFQPYIIQYQKPIVGPDGLPTGETVLTNKVINQRGLEKQMLDDFATLLLSRMSEEDVNMILFNADGTINQTIVLLYGEDLLKLKDYLDTYSENPEEAKAGAKVKAAVERLYRCFEIELTEDNIEALTSNYDTIKNIYSHALYIKTRKGLDAAIKNNTKDLNLIEHHRNDLQSLFSYIVDNSMTTLESVSYEDGKLHYSYVIPSYLSNLIDKLKGNTEDYDLFMEDNFGKYGWFKYKSEDGRENWRNEWLRLLATDESIRKELQHAVVLTTRPVGATASVGYRDKSPMLYAKSMLQNYFYGGDKSIWAFFRIPIMSNKPSEEYIRFRRYIGDSYKDDIAELLVNVALLEIDRIATVRLRNKDNSTVKIKSFDKNGAKFLFLDYLQPILEEYLEWQKNNEGETVYYSEDEEGNIVNERLLLGLMLEQRIQGNENFDNQSYFEDVLTSVIKKSMQQKFEEYLDDMQKEGLLEKDENEDYVHLKDILMFSDSSVEESLENFFWNDTFAAINILLLTVTDIAYYKNAEDLQKRLALIHAPGLRGNKNARWKVNGVQQPITDGKTRTIYIADFDMVVSDAIENIKQALENKANEILKVNPKEAKQFRESAKHIIEAFEDINVTDAQGYNSPTSYRKKAIAFGKWSDSLEDVYQKIRSGNYDTRDLQVMMQPLKPFVYSNTTKQSVGRLGDLKVGMQNKNSEYLLLMMDAILLGEKNNGNPTQSKLAAIYQVMEESHYDALGNYKTDGIDTVQFNSTVKAGEMGVIDINNATTTQLAKEIIEQSIYVNGDRALGYNLDTVHVLNFDDYCIQNEVPAHLEGESIFGSQMRILAISDMPEMVNGVEQFIYYRGKQVSLREVKANYMKAIAENILESLTELEEKFNITGTRALKNIAISKLLQEQIKGDSRFGYDLLYSVCTDENGNFNIPLSDPINAGRVQQLLHSIVKTRINKQMIDGGPVVQVTNFGTSRELDIVFKDANNNRLETLREWFARQDFSEYGSPTYEEFAVMHRYKNAKEGTAQYDLYHNVYVPLRKIVSARYKEEVANKQAGIMYIECYAPSSVFKQFADEDGVIDLNKIPDSMKELIGFRIPTEFKYSMAPLKIVGLLPLEAGEGIMLPKDITTLSGSDFDVDKLYIIRPVVKFDNKKFKEEFERDSAMKYDNKAMWDYIYEHYPEVNEEIKKEQELYYEELKALYGFTGTKAEAILKAGKKSKKDWLEFPEIYFDRAIMDLDTAGELEKYQKGKKVTINEEQFSYGLLRDLRKKDANYYVKIENDDTRNGRNNVIFDTIYAILTSEQAMDLIFTPGNFDEPKLYGYMAEALRLHPEMSYEDVQLVFDKEGVDGLKDLINKSKNLVYNNVHLAFHKQNMVAGKLIGIFALNNVSHSVISLIDLSIKTDNNGNILYDVTNKPKLWRPTINIEEPVIEIEGETIGGGEVSFDALEDKKGRRISNTLAAFLAASVDAVKDPVLNFMNINEVTAGILTSLVRMGYDTELAMLFLTQPVIKDIVLRYAILNEENYVSLDLLILETIDYINDSENGGNDIDTSNLTIPSIDKKSLIKTLRKSTAEDQINLLRALAALNNISRVTSAIVSITKFNSVTAAAGPMLSNTLLMRQRIGENLQMSELLTESMKHAFNNPIIRAFREKEFLAVDSLFKDIMLLANPQFNNIVTTVLEIINGRMDDSMVNKLSDFYIAFMLARGENPIFKTEDNPNPISESRRKYIYKSLPWEIKKLQKDPEMSNNRFLKLIKVMPADDSHEYNWLKINTRGMNGSVHDDVGLYWLELYLQNPDIAMALIEYNFVTSGLGFTANSFANLVPIALKKNIPNYMLLLSNPNAMLNSEEVDRLIDQFVRNNHTNSKIVKRLTKKALTKKYKRGITSGIHMEISKENENIKKENGEYAEYVQYNNKLYKSIDTSGDIVSYKLVSTDASKIRKGTPSIDKKDAVFKTDYLIFSEDVTEVRKGSDYREYIMYENNLFRLDSTIGNKVRYVSVSKLGGKYGEILEINPSGEVEPIDLKRKDKKANKKSKNKKTTKKPGVEYSEDDLFDDMLEPVSDKKSITTLDAMTALIQWFILNKVPESEQKDRITALRKAIYARKNDKAAPENSLRSLFSTYSENGFSEEAFARMTNIGNVVFNAIQGISDVDQLRLNLMVKNILDTKNDLGLCD